MLPLPPELDEVDGDDEMRDKVSSRNCNTKGLYNECGSRQYLFTLLSIIMVD